MAERMTCGALQRELSADKDYNTGKGNAVVTGSSRGIGAAIALALGKAGYNVLVHYHEQKEKAEGIADQIRSMGVRAEVCQADLSRREECGKLFQYAAEKFDTIDVWVNNAGMKGRMPFLEAEIDFVEELYATNLMSVVYCDWHVVRHMVGNGHGHVITVSSIGGQMGFPGNAEYSGGKAALIGRAKAIAKEVGPNGVRYNVVCPGQTQTDMLARSKPEDVEATRLATPLRRLVQPYEIADAVMYLLDAPSMTGQVISVNGGLLMTAW